MFIHFICQPHVSLALRSNVHLCCGLRLVVPRLHGRSLLITVATFPVHSSWVVHRLYLPTPCFACSSSQRPSMLWATVGGSAPLWAFAVDYGGHLLIQRFWDALNISFLA